MPVLCLENMLYATGRITFLDNIFVLRYDPRFLEPGTCEDLDRIHHLNTLTFLLANVKIP
jgi:hypothetical protein